MLRASIALDELERVEAIQRDGTGLHLAGRIGLAVNAPKELESEQRRFRQGLTLARLPKPGDKEREVTMARDIQRALRISRRAARRAKR